MALKRTHSYLHIEIEADCPHCRTRLDVKDQLDIDLEEHLAINGLSKKVQLDQEVICPDCAKKFLVTMLNPY